MEKKMIQVIQDVQKGRPQAFEKLYEQVYPTVYAMAFKIMGNRMDAEDVAQETFIELHRSLHKLREPAFFYAWLNRVVTSKCMNLYNSKKKYVLSETELFDHSSSAFEERRYMLPETSFSHQEDADLLKQLIASMKPQQREILEYVYLKQMKLEEVANVLHIPLGTVKTRVSRARNELKQKVKYFEKKEGRKLDFNLHGTATFSFLGIKALVSTWKQSIHTIFSGMSCTGLQAVCAVVLCAASGGVLFEASQLIQNNQIQEEIKLNGYESVQTFGPYTYADAVVTNSKGAYFTCINWAKDQADMQQKTKGQIRRMLPIYNSLKQQNDVYWNMLKERNWVDAFEIQRKLVGL